MRTSGRADNELRPITIELNPLKSAEGSAVIRWGDNWILCAASVEDRVPLWLENQNKGWVTAEYALLPRSTSTRTSRGGGGRGTEIQRLIGRALRSVVDLTAIGRRTVTIDCDVLQADGGTRVAAITGGYCALTLALHYLWQSGELPTIPLRDYLAGISLGMVDGMTLIDLDAGEDSQAAMDFNLVATGRGQVVEIQGTAEGRPLDRQVIDSLLDLGLESVTKVIEIQRKSLKGLGLDDWIPD